MDETVIYLVRHAEATPRTNLKSIVVNENEQLNCEKQFLTVSGEKNAERISKNKEFSNIDAVYSSNYVSALGTAKYFALENNTIINIDERLNERKIGQMDDMEWKEFIRLQNKDFDFKLSGGESINQVKKRVIEAMKNILMYESGNRVIVVSHSCSLTALLSAWCEIGKNYNDEVILSYNENAIVDGEWSGVKIFKVVFDGMTVKSIDVVNIEG